MQIEFAAELSKEPPTEFRLLKMGANETTKGPINVTPASIEAVLAAIKADGRDENRLPFDFNHAMVNAVRPQDQIAAGWFSVEGRDDGLWIVNAEWTEEAFSGISDRKWRFFSPVLMLNTKTREPTRLINVALTNLPATKDQTPLVASQTAEGFGGNKESSVDEKAVQMLFGALGVSDAKAAESKFSQLSEEVVALKSAAEQFSEENASLKAELEARKEADQVAARDALIVSLSAEGKLAPAMHAWAKTQSIESLNAFGAAAPAQAFKSTQESPKGSEKVALSDDEIAVQKLLGKYKEEGEL